MIEGRTNPLDIARRILKPETMREVQVAEWPHPNLAYSILDRWALNSPDMLQALETEQEGFVLILRLDQQANLEARTLNSDAAWKMSQRGMSDWEILSELGVDTELRSTELI
jgi:hypothetical protein